MKGEDLKKFILKFKVDDSGKQKPIKVIFEDVKKNYGFASVDIRVESEKLAPLEIGLLIGIEIAGGIATYAIIKLLDFLWKKLEQSKIKPEMESIDLVQKTAENYLKEIGVVTFEIVSRETKGLYDSFVFKDSFDSMHHLYVTNFDLQVIKYSRVS